ncbi:MAG: DUF1499 domain-containing protein [Planctomycetes bacterium]|nr:DUF1499 domain-containing protein [Planctomycetota bacterium]
MSHLANAAGGVSAGRLAPCPESPNCVCSQDADARHGILHIPYAGPKDLAHRRLVACLGDMRRAAIITDDGTYVHATFTSAILRFVDDAEFLLDDAAKLIQVRSAARVGSYDFGVNRARIEELRERFAAAAASGP